MTNQNSEQKTLTKAQALATIKAQKHSFHILGSSPFPLLAGVFTLLWLLPQVSLLHGLAENYARFDALHFSVLGLLATIMVWFLNILKESSQGYHTKSVQLGLRLGMLLFIASEVMFFFAFFWGFFHFSLVPSTAVGAVWPAPGTQALSAWDLPLTNTLLLLTSGLTLTVGHAALIKNNHVSFFWHLFLTVLLGTWFLGCQYYEYRFGVQFSWRDNIYGSLFFITTGFHGFHVCLGTLVLLFGWVREYLTSITNIVSTNCGQKPSHHFGFEAAAWYWHFVDVVWLFLFLSIYWWGGSC